MLLNDPVKMQLFHHVCRLLPAETQTEFDRLAAASLGGGGVARDQWPNEGVANISYLLTLMIMIINLLLKDLTTLWMIFANNNRVCVCLCRCSGRHSHR